MSLEMRVVTDGGVSSPKERLNVNLGANEISAKGTSNVSAWGMDLRIWAEILYVRGGVEETCLEHLLK